MYLAYFFMYNPIQKALVGHKNENNFKMTIYHWKFQIFSINPENM